ncbi:MAG: hypothetical protein JXQ90_22835 [Cyclobacteriaceae bacterium]
MRKDEEIDQLIKEALSQEEAEYYQNLDEESMPKMWFDLYRGKMAWMAWMTGVIIVIAVGVTVYCGYQFMTVTSVSEMIKWAAGGFLGLVIVSMLKMWNWLQIERNFQTNQIKKLEYQLSILVSKLSKGNSEKI